MHSEKKKKNNLSINFSQLVLKAHLIILSRRNSWVKVQPRVDAAGAIAFYVTIEM